LGVRRNSERGEVVAEQKNEKNKNGLWKEGIWGENLSQKVKNREKKAAGKKDQTKGQSHEKPPEREGG